MGYFANGFCWSTSGDAVSSFMSGFPRVDTGAVMSAYNHVFDGATGILSVSVRSINLSTGTPSIVPIQTIYFSACDAATVSPQMVPLSVTFDYALAGSFWVFAFSFTVGCWYLAKNLGLILQAIKRF